MKMPDNFAIFILTHGRADNQITLRTLQKAQYDGRLYFLIDNEDKQQERYKELYGDNVIVFDKAAMDGTFDIMDNFNGRNVVVFARNALNEIAKSIGIKYYMVLDDDYQRFEFIVYDAKKTILRRHNISDINNVLSAMLEYFISTPFTCIAMCQGGDLIGGRSSSVWTQHKRKVMNSFLCDTDRPFQFVGRINEDTNTYVELGAKGHLFATIPELVLHQRETQGNPGGLTEFYLETGTYYKSFYTVMLQPSSVHCSLMGQTHKRLHHSIKWKHTVPMIIREVHKKVENGSEG